MSRPRSDDDVTDEGSARALIAGGPSQVSRAHAMRARDINRPSEADLAEAEQSVQVVHRNWKPPR